MRGKVTDYEGEKRDFPYYFPRGWKGLALNVSGIYDDNNNNWLMMDSNPEEWCVLYHGTRSL